LYVAPNGRDLYFLEQGRSRSSTRLGRILTKPSLTPR
jgi:hypothetical protein